MGGCPWTPSCDLQSPAHRLIPVAASILTSLLWSERWTRSGQPRERRMEAMVKVPEWRPLSRLNVAPSPESTNPRGHPLVARVLGRSLVIDSIAVENDFVARRDAHVGRPRELARMLKTQLDWTNANPARAALAHSGTDSGGSLQRSGWTLSTLSFPGTSIPTPRRRLSRGCWRKVGPPEG